MYLKYKQLDDFNEALADEKWLLTSLISADDSWEFKASLSNSGIYRILTLWYTGDEWRSFDYGINEDLTVSTPDVPVKEWPLASDELWLRHIHVQDDCLVVDVVNNGKACRYHCCSNGLLIDNTYRD